MGRDGLAGQDAARADLDKLVRRLRTYTARAWRARDRAAVIRQLAVDLAALSAPGRPVPEIPDHALPDAVAVLGTAALDAPGGGRDAHRLIREVLESTRD